MSWFENLPTLLPYASIFVLVLSRISGLVALAPIFGGADVPMQIRAFLAVAMSLMIAPVQVAAAFTPPGNLPDLFIAMGCELLIGLTLGMGIQLLLAGIQVAGQIISQMSGMSLADVFNPSMEASIPLFSHLLYLFSLAIFVLIGGHRLLMAGLLDTFATIPLAGAPGVTDAVFEAVLLLIEQSFLLGVRAAAPATAALLLATLVLGLISRTLPQLNVMAVGFGVNVITTLLTLSISLAGIAWLFQDSIEPAIATLVEALTASTGG